MKKNIKFGIIGAGKVGSALIHKLSGLGCLAWVLDRSGRIDTAQYPNSVFTNVIKKELPRIDCLIIAVSDKEIENVVTSINDNIDDIQFEFVCHISGNKGIDVLLPLGALGKKIFTAHPMQTFGVRRHDVFDNIFWGLETKDDSRETAHSLVELLGGRAYELPTELLANKSAYHAIGVAAANFMQGAVEFARMLALNAGLPAGDLLSPILRTAFDNSLASISENKIFPLTGPVARADTNTIAEHIKALQGNVELAEIYVSQTKSLAVMALLNGIISKEEFDKIINCTGKTI